MVNVDNIINPARRNQRINQKELSTVYVLTTDVPENYMIIPGKNNHTIWIQSTVYVLLMDVTNNMKKFFKYLSVELHVLSTDLQEG
jgi:hypothetical protein